MPAGNLTTLKQDNLRIIIDYILTSGPISRADLSKQLAISKPTISAGITALVEKKVVLELGYCEAELGKPPMLFEFNKGYKYILALDFISYITSNIVSVAVCNLYCEPVFIGTIDLGENFSAKSITADFANDLLGLFRKKRIPLSKIGVVVLTAASVFYDSEHVRLECRNGDAVNLAEIIRPITNKTILVQNDINLAALGEKHFGIGKDIDNLIFVWAGFAVGGGLILNGELYRGMNNGGGELAYATVYNDVDGEYTFLKDVLSLRGLRKYIDHHKAKAQNSSIAAKLFSRKFSLEDMIAAAKDGDSFCCDFAKHIAKILSAVICNLSATLDLQMAIIGGEYSHFGDLLTGEIQNRISLMPITTTQVTIPMHTNSAMYGAFKIGAEFILKTI